MTSGHVIIDAARAHHVFSLISGTLTRIVARSDQRVKPGDPLATIQHNIDIDMPVTDLQKAEADFIAAEHDYKRKKELYALGELSMADIEMATDAMNNARAERDRQRARASAKFRSAECVVGSERYTLPSPAAGEVFVGMFLPGDFITGTCDGDPKDELFTITELDTVATLSTIDEPALAHLRVGARAVARVAGSASELHGHLDWIEDTKPAHVRCVFDNDGSLRPGMDVVVRIGD